MSQVHRVIVLNKPFKLAFIGLRFTIFQWIVFGLATAFALWVGFTLVPQSWKLGNIPVGLFVAMAIWTPPIAYVMATEMKPAAWWRNRILYGLNVLPKVYLPKREEGVVYPDPTIRDVVKREDQGYVIERDGR